jgi:hypothetical protein
VTDGKKILAPNMFLRYKMAMENFERDCTFIELNSQGIFISTKTQPSGFRASR